MVARPISPGLIPMPKSIPNNKIFFTPTPRIKI